MQSTCATRISMTLLLALLLANVTTPSGDLDAAQRRTSDKLSRQAAMFVAVNQPIVALINVRVIDGTASPAKAGQSILIRDGVIIIVGPSDVVDIPAEAHVMNLEGHTVIPGLVGLHDHSYYTTRARSVQLNFSGPMLYLASGLTTIRTTGSNAPYAEINLRDAIDRGDSLGPRIYVTGPYITGGVGMSSMTRLSGPEDARRVVAYWAEEGVTWFKAYTEITADELEAAIDEAHKHGVKVTGHLCSVSFQEAVALGIDNLEHGFLTNSDYDPEKEPDRCPPTLMQSLEDVDLEGDAVQATYRDMVDHGVALTSTLVVYEMFVPERPPIEQRVLDAMAPAVREEVMSVRNEIDQQGPNARFNGQIFAKAMAWEKGFYDAGGLLAAGVDPTGYGAALPGYGDQRNYELFIEAGFTPVQAIQILSANGAKVLGIYDEVGSVEAGKLADLVVLNGIPEVIGHIKDVRYVFKDGVAYDSPKMIKAVEGLVGIR